MKRFVLHFLLITVCGIGYSQELKRDTIYFNKNWNVTQKGDHKFYRIYEILDTIISVEDYYKNGYLQYKGSYRKADFVINNLNNYSEFPGYEIGIERYFRQSGLIEHVAIIAPFDSTELLVKYGLTNYQFVDSVKSLISLHLYYHKNGLLQSIGFRFDNCDLHGKSVYFTKKGRLHSSTEYSFGKLNGRLTFYYDDGTPSWIVTYSKGRRHGVTVSYKSPGVIKHVKIFSDHKMIAVYKGDELKEYLKGDNLLIE